MKYCIAPWVVQKDFIFLGSRLKAIRLPHLELQDIPAEKLKFLIENNFIIESNSLPDTQYCDIQKTSKKNNYKKNHWIWIEDMHFLEPAIVLKHHLAQLNPSLEWEIVSEKRSIVENLTPDLKPFIIRLSHKEPIAISIHNDLYSDLFNHTILIWIGETLEGTHIGPLIHNKEDLDHYVLSTQSWFFSRQLHEAGFSEYWPILIYYHLVTHPAKVAHSILQIIQSFSSGSCFLIAQQQEVALWSALINQPTSKEDFFKRQFWSKGLIRNFHMTTLDLAPNLYIANCRTPCDGIEYLEGNGGKGITLETATYSLVGESVERFSAWQSNYSSKLTTEPILSSNKISSNKISCSATITYDIHQFHPFGSKWDNYHKFQSPLPMCEVTDIFNPIRKSFVPACLIPFPYESPDLRIDATTITTSGLAAHSDYQRAVTKGALELFERNDFYPHFLFQIPGNILSFSQISCSLQKEWSTIISILNSIEDKHINYWFLIYNAKATLPIVHCFLRDNVNVLMSRGSGSGHSLMESVTGSLLEAIQIRQQLLKKLKHRKEREEDCWTNISIITKVTNYLNICKPISLDKHPLSQVQYSQETLFEEIKQILIELHKPLLVANLPCPIKNWYAVRVLIPGFTTHQYPSQSNGGKHILNPLFTHPIPT